METEKPLGRHSSNGFLDESEQRSYKESAFERAALITSLVTSVTIGPNSSFIEDEKTDEPPEVVTKNKNKTPLSKRERPVIKTSPITPNDLQTMQQKMRQQHDDKKLIEEVRKKVEARIVRENEHYKEIQSMLESIRIENEMKHKAKLEAYERELENALKIIEQEDLIYQKNRMELARNTRKIIEEQEKDIRDNLKRLDDHFGKLEASYGKIVSCCNPDMTQIIEQSNKQLEELKVLKNSSRLSIDGMKSVCSKLEQLCNALINKNKEFEAQAKINQKKAEEAQAAAKAQAEAVQAEAAQQAAAAAAAAVAAPQPLDLPESRPNFQTQTEFTYNELMQYLANKQNLTGQLSTSKELEAMRFALKLAVNNPINHLNEQNKSSLIEGFQNLFKLLSGQRVETNKGSVSINDHPEAPDWVQLRVAEKLIDVCDKKHKTVFFIAALTVALAQKFPGFGEIFLAKLFKECPFLLPHKPLRIQGQSDADFLASWGYKETDQNINGDAHYQGRTSNFAGLLAAIWITYSRRDETAPHPFAIDNCWKFFGNLFNNPPSPMYLHLIDKILEVAGSTMHATYRNHFLKLMILLKGQYLPSVQRYVDDHTQAPFNRLMSSTMLVELRFPPPEGKLTPNYW